MKLDNKTFLNASTISIGLFTALLVLGFLLYKYSNLLLYNYILLVIIFIGITATTLIIASFILVVATYSMDKPTSFRFSGIVRLSYWIVKSFLLPVLYFAVRIFKLNKEQLDKFFIDYNNIVVKATQKKVENSQLVLLLPHCLQNQSCGLKITNNINNCKRCGKCDIGSLAALSDKWGIKAIVVTGGTAARAELVKIKPLAVVSVACERDLASGINDVSSIPVIGVLNMRPNGPCFNTKVDIEKIEQAIIQLVDTSARQRDLSAG